MEKLLSATKKQGGNHDINLTKPTHKKYFLVAVDGYENIFASAPASIKKLNRMQDVLSSSTNTRIIIKTSQLFSGRVIIQLSYSSSSTL